MFAEEYDDYETGFKTRNPSINAKYTHVCSRERPTVNCKWESPSFSDKTSLFWGTPFGKSLKYSDDYARAAETETFPRVLLGKVKF